MPLSIGQVLYNRYRIVRLLGQGGFGAVYRAWDINLSRPVALKENLDASPEAQRQFHREAQLLFDLSHPNLPRTFDSFSVPGQGQYLVMEYVDGEDLLQMQRRIGAPLPEAQVLAWAGQVCATLAYLHGQTPAVVHRDIKPANIKVTSEGQVKLVDFGIAKVYNPHAQTTLGARAITPGYSPPEQYSRGGTDARSDLYALGATLYRLLTGVEPMESVERSLGKGMPAPRALNPLLSPHTELVIMKAMELQADRRFASALEFQAALLKPSSGPPATFQVSMPPQAGHSPVASAPFRLPQTGAPPLSSQSIAGPAQRGWWGQVWPAVIGALVVLGVCGVMWAAYRVGERLAAPDAISGGPALPETTAAPTPTQPQVVISRPTQAGPAAPGGAAPSATPLPEPTATLARKTPTRTPTARPATAEPAAPPTEPAAPRLALEQSFYCRGGPGKSYDLIWSFAGGETLEIIGQSNTGWWLVQFQDKRTSHDKCWINGGVVQGDADSIPFSDFETIK